MPADASDVVLSIVVLFFFAYEGQFVIAASETAIATL